MAEGQGGDHGHKFQSPSLRGSGRFRLGSIPRGARHSICFNPLHCGAVVASSRMPRRWFSACGMFQSPSLRGSGRFRGQRLNNQLESLVSIPFIAGQWSLQPALQGVRLSLAWSQSPSLRGSGRFEGVSPLPGNALLKSQSPSLRGSGRFGWGGRPIYNVNYVSIPFIAGQWSLHARPAVAAARRSVSIPFIAGQWSLRACVRVGGVRFLSSQSPSLRGSGRFRAQQEAAARARKSQSPSLRGSGRFKWICSSSQPRRRSSQSPSLRGSGRFDPDLQSVRLSLACLNPLHCGAVVASRAHARPGAGRC